MLQTAFDELGLSDDERARVTSAYDTMLKRSAYPHITLDESGKIEHVTLKMGTDGDTAFCSASANGRSTYLGQDFSRNAPALQMNWEQSKQFFAVLKARVAAGEFRMEDPEASPVTVEDVDEFQAAWVENRISRNVRSLDHTATDFEDSTSGVRIRDVDASVAVWLKSKELPTEPWYFQPKDFDPRGNIGGDTPQVSQEPEGLQLPPLG